MEYRHLTQEEIDALVRQNCRCHEWDRVMVREGFDTSHIYACRFSGDIRLGAFQKMFPLTSDMTKHSGLYNSALHNVEIGDNCCIENVTNYIADYEIGEDSFIENVDVICMNSASTFGNGVKVSVLNETGGREVTIYDRLSAQEAYIMALYRHRPALTEKINSFIDSYCDSIRSTRGHIGKHVTIADTGYIKDVKIGDYAKIEGCARLKNGSINSNESAPVHIGVNVIADDFVISSGASVEDGVTFSRCFIGQACKLGHGYSATDSLFFGNCQGENGEACAIFAGPYTVTHHKSTLLIAGMFSFMNAGSGSNQSNHMYKLGPIHQGIMERGAKTTSDSYILWPAKIGAFSLVMGRHVKHLDTSLFPFSYLIEDKGTTYIVPGANLKSVGTVRDAQKWPKRDKRADPDRLDNINYNLLSPYTVSKMFCALDEMKILEESCGENCEKYIFHNGRIKSSALVHGRHLYSLAIRKFIGNTIVSRIGKSGAKTLEELHRSFAPSVVGGEGKWVDMAGMIAPQEVVLKVLDEVENGTIKSASELSERFRAIHSGYYDYEWNWVNAKLSSLGYDFSTISIEQLCTLIDGWLAAVVEIDNLLYEDARKEFSLSAMTSFGADGTAQDMEEDFRQVRGSSFEEASFVLMTKEHTKAKSELAASTKQMLCALAR